MMYGDEPVLHICTCAHLLCTAEQDTNLAIPDFREQFLLLCLAVCVMDKCDLVLRDTSGNQFPFNIGIYVERTVILWC